MRNFLKNFASRKSHLALAAGLLGLGAAGAANASGGAWSNYANAPVIRQSNTYYSVQVNPGSTPAGAVISGPVNWNSHYTFPSGSTFQGTIYDASNKQGPTITTQTGSTTVYNTEAAAQAFTVYVAGITSTTKVYSYPLTSTQIQVLVNYSY